VVAGSFGSENWATLLAAAVLLFNAIVGVTSGRALLVYRVVTRSEDGYLYWIAVVASGALGVGGLLTIVL
jgi:uncharacterized membrane-anchored protein